MLALETALSLTIYRPGSGHGLVVLDRSSRLAGGSVMILGSASLTAISGSGPAIVGSSRSAASCTTAPGQRLGHYQLIERLGQGSQGEVWRAFPLEVDGEDVALKILPRALARDPKRIAQFRHEAERGTRIAGPGLLRTFEYGESDGIAYMAMPLVEGCSLGEVIACRRSPTRERLSRSRLHELAFAVESEYLRDVVRILARVARGLAGIHARGVVHLDIKPANILLDHRWRDEGFLCDFGLGRDLDIATPSQVRDGAGTPLYMAPERLMRHHADERLCDIFALGATLFEAVTLVPPLQVPEGLPWHSWHSHLAEAQPSVPSEVRAGVPGALDAIILKAMERLPEHRYRSADALADDLERFLAAEPVRANLACLIA